MADRRRAHRAAAARLTAVALLAGGCGGGDAPAAPDDTFTVAEALDADPDGTIRVRGTLLADASGVRLCTALAESDPPQCGRPSLRVRGLDVVGTSNMEQSKGVGWTKRDVTLVGELEGDVLSVVQ